jgi:hypothetical protein
VSCIGRFDLLIQNERALHRLKLQIVHVDGGALCDRLGPSGLLNFLLQHGFECRQNLGFVVC